MSYSILRTHIMTYTAAYAFIFINVSLLIVEFYCIYATFFYTYSATYTIFFFNPWHNKILLIIIYYGYYPITIRKIILSLMAYVKNKCLKFTLGYFKKLQVVFFYFNLGFFINKLFQSLCLLFLDVLVLFNINVTIHNSSCCSNNSNFFYFPIFNNCFYFSYSTCMSYFYSIIFIIYF